MSTKDKIMDTAEHCFAEQGIATTSVRTICREAGVNLGAITYHFGSKDNLVMAIFRRRAVPLIQERVAWLDALKAEAGDQPISLRKVVKAIVIPQRRLIKQYPQFAEFLIRMKKYPNPKFHELIAAEFREIFKKFDDILRDVLPPMPDDEFMIKMHLFICLMDMNLENDFHIKRLIPETLNSDRVTDILISFVEYGLTSPTVGSEPGGLQKNDDSNEIETGA